MEWLWLFFGLLAGLAMLSMMGSERQRQIELRDAERAKAQAATEAKPDQLVNP
jgi:hypothetical protein